MFKKNTTILFQGDSITDGGRGRSDDLNHILGHGYAYLIAARLGVERPELCLRFHNRGCSGNRVVDLYGRWKEDAITLKPDVISILIGVNDMYSNFVWNTGVDLPRYEKVYRLLLEESRESLPKVRFVLCEPFILPVGAMKKRWRDYRADIDKRRAVVKRLSTEFNAVFVPAQTAFDEAAKKTGADYWMWDGVHPMPAGHELLARAWLSAVRDRFGA